MREQEHGEERADAGLDVGHEEIERFERRQGASQALSRAAVVEIGWRQGSARPGVMRGLVELVRRPFARRRQSFQRLAARAHTVNVDDDSERRLDAGPFGGDGFAGAQPFGDLRRRVRGKA